MHWTSALEPLTRQVEAAERAPGDPGGVWAPLVVGILSLWALHRLLAWMGRRGWINYRGVVLGTAIGNALVGFAAFFQPDRPTVESVERVKNEPVVDDAGSA